MHAPLQPHFNVVCHILHYLKGSPSKGLLYKPTLSVTGFSDNDWAGSHSTRQSTPGYCTFVGALVVILLPSIVKSIKALLVLMLKLSRAMVHIASEMLWVRSLLCDMPPDVPTPMQMQCDNQAAIFIANNLVFH
jgi:hypothetical protein